MKNSIFFALALLFGAKSFAQEQLGASIKHNPFMTAEMQAPAPVQSPSIVSETAVWLHYGTEEYHASLSYTPEGIPFSWAVMFPPSALQSYDGFTLTRVALYETDWNMWNLMLHIYFGNSYMPLALMSEQLYVVQNLEGMHEVDLEQPVEIDDSQYLWIVFSELESTESYSASFSRVDASEADPNARWVQTAENKWEDAANYLSEFAKIQFMIWGYVTDDPWDIGSQLSSAPIGIYPNPALGPFSVNASGHLVIYDMVGQMVKELDVDGQTDIELPAGIYIVAITDENGHRCVRKVVKE